MKNCKSIALMVFQYPFATAWSYQNPASCQIFKKGYSRFENTEFYFFMQYITTRKTIFSKSWNIMESLKRQSKYHLSINFINISHHRKVQNKNFSVISKYHLSITFLAKKRPYFPSLKSSKQKLFSNQWISHFHQAFGSKKDRTFHLQKFQNKNFLVTRKHGIPY